ncbi:MAG: type II toxin-antitoxin system RelE/ParE family toxin [Prolixibacteraceae bacterium]
MANRISYTPIFEKYFKRYTKKFRSLEADLLNLEAQLLHNPDLGVHLGDNLYKIRLAVKSKGKGKRGGFRVITYLLNTYSDGTEITLLIIYDKSEIDDISKDDLMRIVKT